MPPLLTGEIEETTGLHNALAGVKDLTIGCGVLRIASDSFIGLVGISSCNEIIGAVTKDETIGKLTETAAIEKILALTSGTFEYYEVPQKELSRLNQNLNMNISEVLSRYEPQLDDISEPVPEDFAAQESELVDSRSVDQSEIECESEARAESEAQANSESESEAEFIAPANVTEAVSERVASEDAAFDMVDESVVSESEALEESVYQQTTSLESDSEGEIVAPDTLPEEAPANEPFDISALNAIPTPGAKALDVSALDAIPAPGAKTHDSALDAIPTPVSKAGDVGTLDAFPTPGAKDIDLSALDSIPTPGSKPVSQQPTASFLSKIKQKSNQNATTSDETSPDAINGVVAPVPFDPATDEISKNAAATVERIKQFRKPDSELNAEAERAQRAKFLSSRKQTSEPTPTADPSSSELSEAEKAGAQRMRRSGSNQTAPVAEKVKKASIPKPVILGLGAAVAVVGLFFVVRTPIAHYFINDAQSKFDRRDFAGALSSLSPAFVFDSANGQAHFLKGRILSAKGDQKSAYDEYTEALKYSPQDGDILRARLILAWKMGNMETLKADTDYLIANDPRAKVDGYLYGLRAKAELALGQYKDAFDDCNQALKLGQKTPWIYARRGWVLNYMGKPAAAVKEFDTALAFPKSDSTADSYVGKATALAALNDSKGALACYEAAFKVDPKNADFYSRRAFLYNSINQPAKAISDYDTALKLDPSFTQAHIGKADILSRQSKFDEALKELNSVPKKYETAAVYFARARAMMRLNNMKGAIAIFKQGLQKNPKDADAFIDLAYCYGCQKNYTAAIEAVQSAIDLKPNNATYRAFHGLYQFGAGNQVQAGKDYEQALSMDFKNADAHFWRGEMFEYNGNNSAAIQDYQAALSSNPNYEPAKKKIVALNKVVRHSSVNTAAPDLDAVKIIPGTYESLLAQGYAKMKAHDGRGAVNYFASAVSVNPNSSEARKYLAYALAMKGSNSDAISQFQTIVSAGTADATDLRTLGSLALANGRPADGIEPFERLLTTNMNDTDARLKLVECLSKSGQLAKAIEACRNGFKVDAGHTAQYTAMLEKLKTSGSMQNSSVKPVANDNGG